MPEWICPYKNGSLLFIYVQPGAKSTAISGVHDKRLKLRIAAPPRDGEANREVLSFLSECLGLGKSKLEVLKGESGRSKDVYVDLPPEKIIILLKVLS